MEYKLTKELKELGFVPVARDPFALWTGLLSSVRRASSSTLFFFCFFHLLTV